jgi:prepilin-type N-terminal cleavage/methylation domain-containing protein
MHNFKKRNSSNQKGFTIIEVMIVLAIAGLIMLIVFLAVPALQRNSRNTQAKNAAASVMATINEFQTNNNGQKPTAVTIGADGTITASSTVAGTQPATGKTQSGYTASVSNTFPVATGATGNFTVALGYKCTGNTAFAASGRAVAIGYLIEGGSGNVQQCVEG